MSKKKEDRKIIISDNGIGMSFADIRDKWMVVGTNSKRTNEDNKNGKTLQPP